LITKPIALIVTASFCDEARRAKDIVESRFPAPKKIKTQTINFQKKELDDGSNSF
jgi:hypothetical protein